MPHSLIQSAEIQGLIHMIRGQKVMLDSDLAALYGVETRTLVQALKRNRDRFPVDFVFQLAQGEYDALRSQIVISKKGRGGRRYLPHAFTEHGAVMLASILNSPQAIETSVFVVRAFVRLRELASTHRILADKLGELERRVGKHDESIRSLIMAIRELTSSPEPKRRRIGFHKDNKD
jgi:hypothetical protein